MALSEEDRLDESRKIRDFIRQFTGKLNGRVGAFLVCYVNTDNEQMLVTNIPIDRLDEQLNAISQKAKALLSGIANQN